MSRFKAVTFQHTVIVEDHKITIKARQRTRMGNVVGFSALVTDNRGREMKIPHINTYRVDTALDIAYAKFVKELEAV